MNYFLSGLILAITLFFSSQVIAQNAVDRPLKEQLKAQQQSSQIQQNIDQLDDKILALLEEYRNGVTRLEDLNAYNIQMDRLVDDQNAELQKKEAQVRDIVQIQQRIVPFLQRMVDTLAKIISLDTPFLLDERKQRLQQLKKLIHRSDLSIPEKYRRIMEAYRIEAEYGHTLESYQGTIHHDGEPRSVEFLRLGRVGLYYLTLKGDEGGYYLPSSKKWVPLDASLRESVDNAIRIAKKQTPPDLITLPVMAPEVIP